MDEAVDGDVEDVEAEVGEVGVARAGHEVAEGVLVEGLVGEVEAVELREEGGVEEGREVVGGQLAVVEAEVAEGGQVGGGEASEQRVAGEGGGAHAQGRRGGGGGQPLVELGEVGVEEVARVHRRDLRRNGERSAGQAAEEGEGFAGFGGGRGEHAAHHRADDPDGGDVAAGEEEVADR